MKKKYNEGFSLVETLIAIAVLALIVIPTCSGIIMAFRMNAKSDQLMKAQLAVSSAVETLMAEGIPADTENTLDDADYGDADPGKRFEDVVIRVSKADAGSYYTVVVTSVLDEDVSAETCVRAVASDSETQEGDL